MNETFNNRVQRLVLLIDNCHCTTRAITTESTSLALDKVSGAIRGYIFWDFYGACCRLTVKTGGLGIKHKVKFDEAESDVEINTKLRAIFIKMDASWNN